jgi:deoxyribose-phosphate aldolase
MVIKSMTPQTPPTPVEAYESLAGLIDLHLLDPALSTAQVGEGCRLAREARIRAVVVRPCDVNLAREWMGGSQVILATTAGYPHGTSTTAAKLYELRDVLRLGAKEVQFVLNPALMISRSFQHVETELMQASEACRNSGVRLSVWFGNSRLAHDLDIIATKICRRIEASALAIDHNDDDLVVFQPLLKDVLTLQCVTPAATLEEALARRDAGYSSFATTDVGPILGAWQARLEQQAKAS